MSFPVKHVDFSFFRNRYCSIDIRLTSSIKKKENAKYWDTVVLQLLAPAKDGSDAWGLAAVAEVLC